MKKISLQKLESIINESKDLSEPIKKKLFKQADEESKEHPLKTDKSLYRIVVTGLVLIILTCLTFTFCLTLKGGVNEMPEIFMALGSAAVGAIAGLLAPRPSQVDDE